MDLTVAFSTDDGKIFNNSHFGMARYFHVYRFHDEGEPEFIEIRENVKYEEDETIKHGDPGKARATSSALEGVDVMAGRKFGPNIVRLLNKFVCIAVKTENITDAIHLIRSNWITVVKEKEIGADRKHITLREGVKSALDS